MGNGLLSMYANTPGRDMCTLDVAQTVITTLDMVGGALKLTTLDLSHTAIVELDPLSTCRNLVHLDLGWCQRIRDIAPLTLHPLALQFLGLAAIATDEWLPVVAELSSTLKHLDIRACGSALTAEGLKLWLPSHLLENW